MTYIPTKAEQELRRKFGEQLTKARDLAGLTQGKLAEKIGVGPQTISNWERGYYFPDKVDTLLKLANELQCDPDYLLGKLKESTHDIHFVCEFTGLSEEAIKKIHDPELGHPYSEPLSKMIESDRFSNVITTYMFYRNFLKKIKADDLERMSDWEMKEDSVILGRNEAANHFKQEVSIAMVHLCEDDYTKRVSEIIQDIDTPFGLELEPGRAKLIRDESYDKERREWLEK